MFRALDYRLREVGSIQTNPGGVFNCCVEGSLAQSQHYCNIVDTILYMLIHKKKEKKKWNIEKVLLNQNVF